MAPTPSHKSAVRQQNSLQRDELRVALEGRPVAGDAVDGRAAQRIGQGRAHADGQCAAESCADREVADQHQHAGDVDRQHLARERGQREEDRGQEKQVGQNVDEVRLKIRRDHLRTEPRLVEPRHQRAEPRAQTHAAEDQDLHARTPPENARRGNRAW